MGLAPMDNAKEKFNKLKTRDGAYDMLVGEYDYKFLCMVSRLSRLSYITHAMGWVCVRGQWALSALQSTMKPYGVFLVFSNLTDNQARFYIAASLSLPEQGQRISTTSILCP
jgi:hypothetical protein